MIPTKILVAGGVLLLIVLAAWKYTSMAEEIGELGQANSTLEQTAKDWENDYKKIKKIAVLNAATVAKTSKAKNILNSYALKLANELERFKNENIEIKRWAIVYMPSPIVDRLLNPANNETENGLYKPTVGFIGTNTVAKNENLYNYAIKLMTAVQSCNADKEGLRDWFAGAGVILE